MGIRGNTSLNKKRRLQVLHSVIQFFIKKNRFASARVGWGGVWSTHRPLSPPQPSLCASGAGGGSGLADSRGRRALA